MKKFLLALVAVIVCVVSFCACNGTAQSFVFGTFLEIDYKGLKNPSEKIEDYFDDLERWLSPTVEGSYIYRINHAKAGESVECNSVVMEIMRTAEKVYRASNGAYDPSIYPLVRLWNFSGDLYSTVIAKKPPTDEEIEKAKALVGLDNAFTIDYENCTVTKNEGYDDAMLDFGGVAKGYAVDTAEDDVDCKALINLGGNIVACNETYTIGIGNPRETGTSYFGSLTLEAGECISTSGDYERYYDYDGVRYHHIINPYTGRPSDSGVISVSVITSDGALGDAVATAVLVLGKDAGKELLETLSLRAVIISEDLSYEVVGNVDFSKK